MIEYFKTEVICPKCRGRKITAMSYLARGKYYHVESITCKRCEFKLKINISKEQECNNSEFAIHMGIDLIRSEEMIGKEITWDSKHKNGKNNSSSEERQGDIIAVIRPKESTEEVMANIGIFDQLIGTNKSKYSGYLVERYPDGKYEHVLEKDARIVEENKDNASNNIIKFPVQETKAKDKN